MGRSFYALGAAGWLMLALTPACVATPLDSESDVSGDDALSGYLTGIVAIDAQNSSNAASLLDGQTGASLTPWVSSNIYPSSNYPMRAVFDLGQVYDVSEVGLFHGNGSGLVNVKALPEGADSTKDASYTPVEAHVPSLWNAWETVKQSGTFRTRYVELTITSYANFAAYSEIRVKGTPVAGPPPPPPPPANGLTKVATGEYQSFFLVDGQIYALGIGQTLGVAGTSMGVPLPVVFPAGLKFKDVQSGLHQTLAADQNGHVWVWGTNGSGVGGLGTIGGNEIETPQMIPQDADGNPFDGVIQVTSHYAQDWALKSDGTVWFWGDCSHGICGTPSLNGTSVSRPSKIPIPLPSGVKIVKISSSALVLALASDGSVWSWGNVGGYGNQYDIANGTDGSSPAKIATLPGNIVDVATSIDFNYALTSTGELWGFGMHGAYMGFADGHPIMPQSLKSVLGLPAPVKAIGVNDDTTHVVLTDGTLWGWGANGQGAVGNLAGPDWAQTQGNDSVWGGAQVMVTSPVPVAPSVHDFTAIFAQQTFAFYVFAMTSSGELYFMGRNKTGIAGDGIYPGAASGSYWAALDICASYPNSWDVPLAKHVSPMSLTKGTPTLSPYCIANPGTAPCNFQ